MRRLALHFVPVFLLLSIVSSAQNSPRRYPRDAEKLWQRVTEYYSHMVAGRRTKALSFILPDQRDAFLSGVAPSIVEATVLGIDATADPNRAVVRVQVRLQALMPEVNLDQSSLVINDPWVRRGSDWYSELVSLPGIAGALKTPSDGKDPQVEAMVHLISDTLKIPNSLVQLGRASQHQHYTLKVPVEYTGKYPLVVESAFPIPHFQISEDQGGVTPAKPYFLVYVDTADFEGPFSVTLQARFRYEAASIEKTIKITGDVFQPISFRRSPLGHPLQEGDRVSIFIQNNTDEPIEINPIEDERFSVVKAVKLLNPHAESEVIITINSADIPDRLFVVPAKPVNGQTQFVFYLNTRD